MADADVVLDRRFDVDPIEGTAVVLSAIESSTHPGDYSYGFQYFQPKKNDEILRCDNSKVPEHDAGYHHCHSDSDNEITEIEFAELSDHVSRFLNEVDEINDSRQPREEP